MAYCSNGGNSVKSVMGGYDIGLAINPMGSKDKKSRVICMWHLAFNPDLGFKEAIVDPSLLHVLMMTFQSLLIG